MLAGTRTTQLGLDYTLDLELKDCFGYIVSQQEIIETTTKGKGQNLG
jgi:hypothetical protein